RREVREPGVEIGHRDLVEEPQGIARGLPLVPFDLRQLRRREPTARVPGLPGAPGEVPLHRVAEEMAESEDLRRDRPPRLDMDLSAVEISGEWRRDVDESHGNPVAGFDVRPDE